MPRSPNTGRHRRPRESRAPIARGRHAAPLCVLPRPAVQEVALAIRGWAADAPALTVEAWRMLGRERRHQVLATLAAAGLVLVLVPVVRQGSVEVARSEAAEVAAGSRAPDRPASRATARGGRDAARAAGKHRAGDSPASTTPARPAPRPSTSAAPASPEPLVAVPPGSGPANSQRTTGTRAIALTFDDGPDPVQTPKILALLAEYHVTATFCLIGRNVQRHPDIVRQIVAAGHTLCDHTWDHRLTIGTESPDAIRADLERTNAAIHDAAPHAKIKYFRAPGGHFTDRLVSVAYQMGMTSLYWQVDPRDWDHSTDPTEAAHIERVVDTVESGVRPGSIVLSHDYRQPDTVEAYRRLLPYLTEHFTVGRPPAPAKPAPAEPSPPASSPPPRQPAPSSSGSGGLPVPSGS